MPPIMVVVELEGLSKYRLVALSSMLSLIKNVCKNITLLIMGGVLQIMSHLDNQLFV